MSRGIVRARRGPVWAGLASSMVVIGLSVGGAAAAPGTGAPSDDRAEYIEGNVQDDVCPTGTTAVTGSLTFTGGTGTGSVTITAVADGVTVTHIYVKGGPDTNLYRPGQLGLPATPPWEDLIAPENSGGNVANISHWFACGTTNGATTTTTTIAATTTTQAATTTTAAATTTTAAATTTSVAATTTTTTVPADTTTTTTQPGATTTTTTQPGDTTTTTTQPGQTTTTLAPTTTHRATTTTTKLPTTGSNNLGAVVALALVALAAGGGAIVLARRNH